jgi:hypothetical protein
VILKVIDLEILKHLDLMRAILMGWHLVTNLATQKGFQRLMG